MDPPQPSHKPTPHRQRGRPTSGLAPGGWAYHRGPTTHDGGAIKGPRLSRIPGPTTARREGTVHSPGEQL
eukprot:9526289-Prorocentrum_lima.AAC.1